VSIDGTHTKMYEPKHHLFPYDKDYCSYKHNTAGFNYQIALSTVEQKICAVDGPFPAGSHNDKKIFNECELKQKLVAQNKRAIADGGYNGLAGVATPNGRFDSKETNRYKRRIRARHESFNARIKNFAILSGTFRHKKDRAVRHKIVFEAICVIVATQMVTGSPLFEA
jgi:hypothetical protein